MYDSVISFRWDSLIFSASAHQPILMDNPKPGSRMHFLRALYSGQLRANGYFIDPSLRQVSITGYRDSDSWPGIKFVFVDPEGYPDKMLICPEEPLSTIPSYSQDISVDRGFQPCCRMISCSNNENNSHN
jgi:hypothetical protein